MSHVIDYYATLGRLNNKLTPKKVANYAEEMVDPSVLWMEAITDIAVVYPNEKIPKGQDNGQWSIITTSVEGKELTAPHMAVRRRKHSGKVSHITSIMHVMPGQQVPPGYELITHSLSGQYSAYINANLGYIAVTRSTGSALEYLRGKPFIEDIQVVVLAQGEDIPDRYMEAEHIVESKSLSSTMAAAMSGTKLPKEVDLDVVAVAYRLTEAIGLCDLHYEGETLDRYPQEDDVSMPLPAAELPVFAFPHGLTTDFTVKNNYPIPKFFTFVFTNAEGGHLYAACLRFWEKVPSSEVTSLFESVFGDDKEINLSSGTNLFTPQVICVVSSKPFYRAMRRYLRQLYSLSLSQCKVPLEYFVSTLVSRVPVPIAGGRPFHVSLDAALVSESSRTLPPIVFDLPHERSFPHMDIDFAGPLRCLSLDHVLAVFVLLLREAKVAFVCSSGTILTETMETFRALLFPLTWSSAFVSRLPESLSGLLQAPGGFMLGLHIDQPQDKNVFKAKRSSTLAGVNGENGSNSRGNSSGVSTGASADVTTSLGAAAVALAGGRTKKTLPVDFEIWREAFPVGAYVVDLSGDAIFRHNGVDVEQLPRQELNDLIESMPRLPRRRLMRVLQDITSAFRMGPTFGSTVVTLADYDSAFDMHKPAMGMDDGDGASTQPGQANRWQRFPTAEVRDAFLVFMVDVLREYQHYIIPPDTELGSGKSNTFRTFQELFHVSQYVGEAELRCRAYLERLVETQMFSYLVQQRHEGTSQTLFFYEKCARLLRRLDLHLCSNFMPPVISQPNSPLLELPAPVHKMLMASERLQQMTSDDLVRMRPVQRVNVDSHKTSPKSKSRGMAGMMGGVTSPMDMISRQLGNGKGGDQRTHDNSMDNGSSNRSGYSSESTPSAVNTTISLADDSDSEPAVTLDLIMVVLYKQDQTEALHKGPSSVDTLEGSGVPHSSRYELHDVFAKHDGDRAIVSHLELHDKTYGPLTIPGPALKDFGATGAATPPKEGAGDREEEGEDEGADAGETWTYKEGWPKLNLALLNRGRQTRVHPLVRKLAEDHVRVHAEVDTLLPATLLREESERLSFCYTASLTNTAHFFGGRFDVLSSVMNIGAATGSGGNSTPISSASTASVARRKGPNVDDYLTKEVQAVVSTVLEAYCGIITRLVLRALSKPRPETTNKGGTGVCDTRSEEGGSVTSDVLQILGILSHLESLGLLAFLDERIWRAILFVCGHIGGHLMRRVSAVLYNCAVSFSAHLDSDIDPLTYGLYASAVNGSKAKPRNDPTNLPIDPFMYVEEIGLTWFTQRAAFDAIDAANTIESGMVSPTRNNSFGSTDARPRRASFIDMMGRGQPHHHHGQPSVGHMSPSTTGLSPQKSIGDRSNGYGSSDSGTPASESKEAIYREFQYKATTSCSYVAREMGLSCFEDSSAEGKGCGLFNMPRFSSSRPWHCSPLYVPSPSPAEQSVTAKLKVRLERIYQNAEPMRLHATAPASKQLHLDMPARKRLSRRDTTVLSKSPPHSSMESLSSSNANKSANDANSTARGRSRTSSGAGSSMMSALRALSSPNLVDATGTVAERGTASPTPEAGATPTTGRERRPSYAARLNTFFGFEAEKEAQDAVAALELEEATELEVSGRGSDEGCKGEEGSNKSAAISEALMRDTLPADERPTEVTNPTSIMGSSHTGISAVASPSGISKSSREKVLDGDEEEDEGEEEGYGSMPVEPARQRAITTVPPEQRLTKHRPKRQEVVGALASDFSDNEDDDSEGDETDSNTNVTTARKHRGEMSGGEGSSGGGGGETAPTPPSLVEKEAHEDESAEGGVPTAPPQPPAGPDSTHPSLPPSSLDLADESCSLRVLQEEVLDVHKGHLLCTDAPSTTSSYVVTISGHMLCVCGREMLEEELLATWTAEHKEKVRFRLNVHEYSQDIDMAHNVLCVGCNKLITPSLTVTCYATNTQPTEPESKGVGEIWSVQVPHLSPYGMIFKHEQLLKRYGTDLAKEHVLHDLSPALYWNIHLYSTRLCAPSGLSSTPSIKVEGNRVDVSSPGPVACPILVGWRPALLRARASALLCGESAPDRGAIDLSLIFPTLSKADLTILTRVQALLDGSQEHLRAALVELCQVPTLINRNDKPASIAASLYNSLLTLAHAGRTPLSKDTGENIFTLLNRPTAFDVTFYNCLKQTLEPSDLEYLQLEETDLVHCLPNRAMMGYRLAWGLLL